MAKIQASALISLFKQMARENWAYVWGKAEKGVVDCSGAFVYTFKTLGNISLPHGSNAIVRQYAENLLPIDSAKPGYVCTKCKADFENANLESKYGKDGLGNHYHIGLMGDDGKIYNAQSSKTGFVASDPKGWRYCFQMKNVDYGEITEEEGEVMTLYKAKVTTQKDPLNVRDAPKTGRIIGKLPIGTVVEVLKEGEFARIRYGELVGYASSAYLQKTEEVENDESISKTATTDESETVILPRNAVSDLADAVYALEGMDTFGNLIAAIAKLQSAAMVCAAYLNEGRD